MTRSDVSRHHAIALHQCEQKLDGARHVAGARGPSAHGSLVHMQEVGAGVLRQAEACQRGAKGFGAHSSTTISYRAPSRSTASQYWSRCASSKQYMLSTPPPAAMNVSWSSATTRTKSPAARRAAMARRRMSGVEVISVSSGHQALPNDQSVSDILSGVNTKAAA